MVTLRSEGKSAAAVKQPYASQPRMRVRSATPDRASQDSGLRRSQRVRDRHGALESIQEDTAASAGGSHLPVRLIGECHTVVTSCTPARKYLGTYTDCGVVEAESGKHARIREEVAEEGAEAVPAPAVCRAQAVQQAILQASDSNTSSPPPNSAGMAESSDADASDSETSDDHMAKLGHSMLRSEANSKDADYRAPENGIAERNSMRASQPDVLQTAPQRATHGRPCCLRFCAAGAADIAGAMHVVCVNASS